MKAPLIYDYGRFSEFLRAFIQYQKHLNAKFSYELFARRLGVKSRSLLAMIAKGTRLPTPDIYTRICDSAGLTAEERVYADLLLAVERSKSLGEKDFAVTRLDQMRPAVSALQISADALELIADWRHTAILEMTSLADFRADAAWIAGRLAFPVAAEDIESCIERLLRAGLLVRSEDGGLTRASVSNQSSSNVPSRAIRSFHRGVLALASDALEMQTVAERYVAGISFNIDLEQLSEAKALLVEFERRFVKLLQRAPGEATYHLELAFFSLTKN